MRGDLHLLAPWTITVLFIHKEISGRLNNLGLKQHLRAHGNPSRWIFIHPAKSQIELTLKPTQAELQIDIIYLIILGFT